ncbi:putative ethanolamine ammonia-lyase heavy chain domain protein [Mycobacteroides abscessus]|nr:putative ethanolamine ammonia-lyase heavy chain domain protein [Mycobacteroides abscessus]
MIFQPGPDDLLSIVKIFRPNESTTVLTRSGSTSRATA